MIHCFATTYMYHIHVPHILEDCIVTDSNDIPIMGDDIYSYESCEQLKNPLPESRVMLNISVLIHTKNTTIPNGSYQST